MTDLQQKILYLREKGYTVEQVANELEISIPAIKKELRDLFKDEEKEKQQEKSRELRYIVERRVDAAIRAISQQVQAGDLYAIDRLVKLNDQLIKLAGPAQIDLTTGGEKLPTPQTPQTPQIEVILSEARKDQ